MKEGKELKFETSRELKSLFSELYDKWRKKNPEGLEDLALKCGVSPAYLAHVRRYGRIPGTPVLILLALNFGIDGRRLFRAAGERDPFPYEENLGIAPIEKPEAGLLSVQLNMDGFTDAIRNLVRSELKQRTAKEVLSKRPVRIGLNYHQFWVYESSEPPTQGNHTGNFPDFCRMLAVALQREVELVYLPYSEYISSMEQGELDFYGPVFNAPKLPSAILFSTPLFKVGVSGIARKRQTPGLEELPLPKSVDDLRQYPYQIAVLRNSYTEILLKTSYKRKEEQLILVDSDDEGIERVLLRGVKKPAHLFFLNSGSAILNAKKYPNDLQPVFATSSTLLDMVDSSIAVRPDWPEVMPVLNDAIKFLLDRGGFAERLEKSTPAEIKRVVEAA